MPVDMCRKCGRLISISNIPGGNPVAKADPEHWAMSYGRCDRCEQSFCDRCIEANAGKCPGCGRRLTIKGPP